MAKNYLEFANFICKFGEEKVLLDLAEEVVIPAFMSPDLERDVSTATYFFHDVQIIELGHDMNLPILAIIGRFVKDMTLSREQIYNNRTQELVPDKHEIKSSPSSIFVLILNNHRLLYLPETKNAPGLASFETTIRSFIKEKHDNFIDSLHENRGDQRLTMSSLLSEFPRPTIEIIPIANASSFEEFIKNFGILESIRIKFVPTNNEIDNNEFFELVRDSATDLDSKVTTLEYENRQGLSKDPAISKLKAAASQGSSKLSFAGKDLEGEKLRGTNKDFKVSIPMPNIPKKLVDTANQMLSMFKAQIDKGLLEDSFGRQEPTEKIKRLQAYIVQRDSETK